MHCDNLNQRKIGECVRALATPKNKNQLTEINKT